MAKHTNDWSWKGNETEKKQIREWKKKEKKRKSKKQKRESNCFYKSREWLELRYRVIRKYEGNCMACGRNYRRDRVKLHVDHIKPRSKHPHLELCFENLQILCAACNYGKSNKDETDWRPEDKSEIYLVLEANKHI